MSSALALAAAVLLGTGDARGGEETPAAPPASELEGTWAGTLVHDGESRPIALGFERDSTGRVAISLSIPAVHLDRVAIGRVAPVVDGDSVRLGPFRFAFDRAAGTLSGVMPAGLVPVYEIPLVLRRTERFAAPERPPLRGPEAAPLWTFEARSPVWAGPTCADGAVFAGAQDGRMHALDARTGAPRWQRATGGPIRARPTVARGELYVPSDDGFLYKLEANTGQLRWRVKIVEKPVERLPFDRPGSRFDRFGSEVTFSGNRLYVGTHDGKMLALDARDGRRVWSFAANDAVLAAPAVRDGNVLFGSYDRFVYAIEARSGRLIWKRDTHGAVVSTPALVGDRAIVGNRCYDLLALDLGSGEVAWKRYIWMSWVESSATIRDGVAYVGSSDAAAIFAFDAATGARRWSADVFGWSWGQPAVGTHRVYAGTSGQVGYPVRHAAGLIALDRATGRVAWRFAAAVPDSGAYGFAGSPALGDGRVYASDLEGRIHAFAE